MTAGPWRFCPERLLPIFPRGRDVVYHRQAQLVALFQHATRLDADPSFNGQNCNLLARGEAFS